MLVDMISQFLILIITWIRFFDSSVLAFHLSNNQWRSNRQSHHKSLPFKQNSNIRSCKLYSNGRELAPVERWSDNRLITSSPTSAPVWSTNSHARGRLDDPEYSRQQPSIQSMVSHLAEAAISSDHAEISRVTEEGRRGEGRLTAISSSLRKVLFLHEKNLAFLEGNLWEELSGRYEAWLSAVNEVLVSPSSSSMKSFRMHYRAMLMALEMLLDGYLRSTMRLRIDQDADCGDVENEEDGASQRHQMTESREDMREARESLQVMYDLVEALLGDMREMYRRMEARGMLSRQEVGRGIDDGRQIGVRLGRSESVIGNLCGMMEEAQRLYVVVNGRSGMREGSMMPRQSMSMMSRSVQMEKEKNEETVTIATAASAVGKDQDKIVILDGSLKHGSQQQRQFLHELQRVSQSLHQGGEAKGVSTRKRLEVLLDLRRLFEHESATMPDNRGELIDHSCAQLLTMDKLIYFLLNVRQPSFKLPDYVSTYAHHSYLVHDVEDVPPNEIVAQGYIRLVANLYPLFSSNSPVLRLLPAAPSWQDMKVLPVNNVPVLETQGGQEISVDKRLLSLPFYRYHGLAIASFSHFNMFIFGSQYFSFKPDSHVMSFLFDYVDKLLDNYESLQSAPEDVRDSSLHQQMKRAYEHLIQDLIL